MHMHPPVRKSRAVAALAAGLFALMLKHSATTTQNTPAQDTEKEKMKAHRQASTPAAERAAAAAAAPAMAAPQPTAPQPRRGRRPRESTVRRPGGRNVGQRFRQHLIYREKRNLPYLAECHARHGHHKEPQPLTYAHAKHLGQSHRSCQCHGLPIAEAPSSRRSTVPCPSCCMSCIGLCQLLQQGGCKVDDRCKEQGGAWRWANG